MVLKVVGRDPPDHVKVPLSITGEGKEKAGRKRCSGVGEGLAWGQEGGGV